MFSRWDRVSLVMKVVSKEIRHIARVGRGNVLLQSQEPQVAEVCHKGVGFPWQQELDLWPSETVAMENNAVVVILKGSDIGIKIVR